MDAVLLLIACAAVALVWYRDRGRGATSGSPRKPTRYAVIWVRYFFGFHALYSGPNYFLHLYPQMQMVHPLAGPFQHYMEAVGLFGIVKLIESIVGVCLVLDVFVPLAAIIEMPISFTICWLSVFVVADPRTLWTGPRELLLNAFLVLAYGGWVAPILRPRVAPRPLWASEPIKASLTKPQA